MQLIRPGRLTRCIQSPLSLRICYLLCVDKAERRICCEKSIGGGVGAAGYTICHDGYPAMRTAVGVAFRFFLEGAPEVGWMEDSGFERKKESEGEKKKVKPSALPSCW
jgi:hypothetical protein